MPKHERFAFNDAGTGADAGRKAAIFGGDVGKGADADAKAGIFGGDAGTGTDASMKADIFCGDAGMGAAILALRVELEDEHVYDLRTLGAW